MVFNLRKGNRHKLRNRCLSVMIAAALTLPLVIPSELLVAKAYKVKSAETTVKYGDVNSDGSINVFDMIYLKSYFIEKNEKTISLQAVDLDGDGKVSGQ